MANLALPALKREKTTKAGLSSMRRAGRIPAVIYGLNMDSELVEVNATDMRTHLTKRNHVIDLTVSGKSQQVLIKAVERDPIRRDLIHIDFLRVNNERPVIVKVPVLTHGVPFGVKTEGGVFSVMKKFVKLRAKVQDIPDNFDIDVNELKHGTIFYVKDLTFGKGTFVTPGKTALFGVTTGKAEEEVVVAAPVAAAAAPAGAPAAPGTAPAADKAVAGKAAPGGKDGDKNKGKDKK